ncbi:DnaJ-like [Gracilariopsis chorda]|uniref:DnaJ-like n=1 Tax=Gracilariopsis chorda TaxID=448386 RepID=A0A2V3IHK2_9FLOR|nr:DnaJ-like [Gracilariopsis chorda]|eukprot:PXF41557.1 DnaJ-like [Gracilariopsis chorda]
MYIPDTDRDLRRLYVQDRPVQTREELLHNFFGSDGVSRLRSGFRVQPSGGITSVEYENDIEGVAAFSRHFFPRTWSTSFVATATLIWNENGLPPQPPDLEATVHCSLEELFHGAKRCVQIIRCVTREDGSIVREPLQRSLPVKPGYRAGTRIKFKGIGNQMTACTNGDVVFTIVEKKHPRFERCGDNLYAKQSITLADGLTKDKITFMGIDGSPLEINGSAVIARHFASKSGVHVCIPGAGMPYFRDATRRGDLHISFSIVYPPQSASLPSLNQDQNTHAFSSPSSISLRRLAREAHANSFARLRRILRFSQRDHILSMWCNIFERQISPSLRIEAPPDSEPEEWGSMRYTFLGSERSLRRRLRCFMTPDRSMRDQEFSAARGQSEEESCARSQSSHSSSPWRHIRGWLKSMVHILWKREPRRPNGMFNAD